VIIKLIPTVLALGLFTACNVNSSSNLTSLSDMTLCDNVLNYNGRNPDLQNARTQELSGRGQDCSTYAHLKRENVDVEERPNQKRRRRPFGKDFPR
jgi:hypothetical protein